MGGRVPVSREGKADRDKGHMVRPWRRQKCADILGKGGEDRAWRHDKCLRD
jgi:hypothetical protein